MAKILCFLKLYLGGYATSDIGLFRLNFLLLLRFKHIIWRKFANYLLFCVLGGIPYSLFILIQNAARMIVLFSPIELSIKCVNHFTSIVILFILYFHDEVRNSKFFSKINLNNVSVELFIVLSFYDRYFSACA